MADSAVTVEGPETLEAPVEPLRVLIPSALGDLGIEFRERTVTRLTIAPKRGDRARFTPLKEAFKQQPGDFLDEALGRFSEFLAGARRRLELDWEFNEEEVDDFGTRVLKEVATIPYGETRTYHKIASGVGEPDAYRLVRSALMANPIPILIPCHRVVPVKSGPGSWIGGTKRKGWLLKLEERTQRGQGG